MKKCALLLAAILLASMPRSFAADVPEGAIWDRQYVDALGDPAHTTIMIEHGEILTVTETGSQHNYGHVVLNGYNEYEVPQELNPNGAYQTMTFRFSPDFSTVTMVYVTKVDISKGCVAGDCGNPVVTAVFQRR